LLRLRIWTTPLTTCKTVHTTWITHPTTCEIVHTTWITVPTTPTRQMGFMTTQEIELGMK